MMRAGLWTRAAKPFARHRAALAGLAVAGLLAFLALFAPFLAPFEPFALSGDPFQPPGASHLMGTDNMGRDILSAVLYGARTSLVVGFFAAVTSTAVGLLVGALAGFHGGRVDAVLMRITDVFMIIPPFFLAVLVVAFIGAEIRNLILVIGLVSWPAIARLLRAEFLKWKQMDFVDAARLSGASRWELVFREILPNALPPVIVVATLQVGFAILAEASLSFVGLGDPNVMSWGYLLRNAQTYLRSGWWIAAFPGLAVLLTVLSIHLVGEGVNDAIDPRMKKARG